MLEGLLDLASSAMDNCKALANASSSSNSTLAGAALELEEDEDDDFSNSFAPKALSLASLAFYIFDKINQGKE